MNKQLQPITFSIVGKRFPEPIPATRENIEKYFKRGANKNTEIEELKQMVLKLTNDLAPAVDFFNDPKTATVALDTESLSEIKKLKDDLAPMNKALKYKAKNVVKQSAKEQIREQIRARKLLKSGS